jgi:hypothetical protein
MAGVLRLTFDRGTILIARSASSPARADTRSTSLAEGGDGFIAGHSDRRVLTRAIDAAFRRVRQRDGDTQLRREARAIASSLDWLVDERWLERSDARDLRGFMNKVLP